MATNSHNFVTQATNFLSAVSGAVDPRTGLYGISVNLGKFAGNRGLGPGLPLSLQYSPLQTSDFGLGKGVKLDITAYRRNVDNEPQAILLSTGEQYGVQEDNGDVTVLQQRLKSFTFTTQRNQDGDVTGYLVAHKSGALEFLRAGLPICMPHTIYTSAGHWLSFSWIENQGTPNLHTIADEYGTPLLSADYSDFGATFNILPGNTTEGYRVDFNFQNRMLNSIVAKASDGQEIKWTFTVNAVGDGTWGSWITGMTAPGGLVETAFYPKSGGHQFPQGAPYRSGYPFVTKFERKPGAGQPAIVSAFNFSKTNFLGGFSGKNWQTNPANQDLLMTGPFDDNYKYWSEEVQLHSASSQQRNITARRTYNAYHLQVRETISSGKVKKITTNNHDIQPNVTLDGQPHYYQLPTSKFVSWDNGDGVPYTEKTAYTWDDWGNPVTKTDPDGAVTTWSYFYERPGDQSDQNLPVDPDCPKDPNGFVRYVKWMRVDPTQAACALKDARIQQTDYRYALFPACQNDRIAGMVLKRFESHSSGGAIDARSGELNGATLLSEASFDYLDGGDAGRLKTHAFTHYARDAGGETYLTTEQFAYPSTTDQVQTSHTLTTYDGHTITDTKTVSSFTGRVLRTTDLQLNVTTHTYDCFGRPKTRTLNSSSSDGYQNHWTYENYVNQPDCSGNHAGTWPFQTVQSDGKQNKICYTMDGHGNVIFTDVNDRDSTDPTKFHNTEIHQYDDRGRLSSTTGLDYDLANNVTFSLVKTLAYDDWGNPASIGYSDGTTETQQHDPARKTVSVTHGGPNTVTGTQVTTYDYDFSKKPIKIERYLASQKAGVDAPYSTHTKEYDGLHHLRSETEQSDADGSGVSSTFKTAYTYDAWGRLSHTQLPDQTTVVRQYSDTSPEKYVNDISVAGKSVGERTFDGLGRVTAKTVSGKKWTYEYATATDSKPRTETTPDNVTLTYTYDPQLSEALGSVSVADVTQNYHYDPVSGIMDGARSNAAGESSSTKFDLYDSGRLKSETIQYDGNDAPQSTLFHYTVGGALLSYRHVDNAVSSVSRDSHGRILQVADEDVSVSPRYDSAGRLTGWTAAELVNGNPGHTLTTTLTLDDLGRETSRTVRDNRTQDAWTTTQTWYRNDLLTERVVSKNGGGTNKYTYRYDSRNRLTSWTVEQPEGNGPSRPSDRYGNEMTGQDFTIDGYGNITLATTHFNTETSDTNDAAFTYDVTHPCLLVGVSNTHPSYPGGGQVEYDEAGRITYDGMETRLTYDKLGRVCSANSTLTGLQGTYGYDHHNRLYRQTRSDQTEPIYFYYKLHDKLDQLVNLIQGDDRQRLFRSLSGAPAAQLNTGSNAGAWLLGADMLGSVSVGSDGKNVEEPVYSAYGEEAVKTRTP